jgi:type IV pilus assembly protein PilW
MTASRTSPPRGFTLVEMVIALGVSTIVIFGAVTLLVSQQRIFRTTGRDRALQETGRVALEEITTNLRMAGYGLDPSLAFVFGPSTSVPIAQSPKGVALPAPTMPGFACPAAVTCRDSATGPDELVFQYRNPAFGHDVITASSTSSSLKLRGPLNVPLYKGQLLQVSCYGGGMYQAYVTVGSYVAPSTNDVSVPLMAGAGMAFGAQNDALAKATCFSSGVVRAFKIERYRYYVQRIDDSGTPAAWAAASVRPYLLLDRGLVDENGRAVAVVIAADVEDLQVAYVFPRTQSGQPVVGATVGTAIVDGPTGIDLAPAQGVPTLTTPTRSILRRTNWPGNIRAVRVGLVARSATADSDLSNASVPALFNRDAIPGAPGFIRMVFQTTAVVPNMLSQSPSFPAYSSAPADRLNAGGG